MLETEDKSDKVTKSEESSFGKAFTKVFTDLKKLRTSDTANWKAIEKANSALKSEWDRAKEKVKALKTGEAKTVLNDLIGTLTPQGKVILAAQLKIKAAKTEKDTQWKKFRAAIKAKNKTAASAALNKIIVLKQQIITEQAKMISVKNKIIQKLKVTNPNPS